MKFRHDAINTFILHFLVGTSEFNSIWCQTRFHISITVSRQKFELLSEVVVVMVPMAETKPRSTVAEAAFTAPAAPAAEADEQVLAFSGIRVVTY